MPYGFSYFPASGTLNFIYILGNEVFPRWSLSSTTARSGFYAVLQRVWAEVRITCVFLVPSAVISSVQLIMGHNLAHSELETHQCLREMLSYKLVSPGKDRNLPSCSNNFKPNPLRIFPQGEKKSMNIRKMMNQVCRKGFLVILSPRRGWGQPYISTGKHISPF